MILGYIDTMSGRKNLPPIVKSPQPLTSSMVSNERDRDFLNKLNFFIEKELGKIDRDDEEQRYIVYKAAFDKVNTLSNL